VSERKYDYNDYLEDHAALKREKERLGPFNLARLAREKEAPKRVLTPRERAYLEFLFAGPGDFF